ncbi:hypothetical protein [uncultured Bartonella sp.]|uniref:hypothetical protein n=1 Tax=uncultured Bartonella sp. TaxID=104108 RepID=UPI0025F278E0|nr:hypothetical protein [uncultured Bartonella sp.]
MHDICDGLSNNDNATGNIITLTDEGKKIGGSIFGDQNLTVVRIGTFTGNTLNPVHLPSDIADCVRPKA